MPVRLWGARARAHAHARLRTWVRTRACACTYAGARACQCSQKIGPLLTLRSYQPKSRRGPSLVLFLFVLKSYHDRCSHLIPHSTPFRPRHHPPTPPPPPPPPPPPAHGT